MDGVKINHRPSFGGLRCAFIDFADMPGARRAVTARHILGGRRAKVVYNWNSTPRKPPKRGRHSSPSARERLTQRRVAAPESSGSADAVPAAARCTVPKPRAAAPLPRTLCCVACGEELPLAQFSNKQQKAGDWVHCRSCMSRRVEHKEAWQTQNRTTCPLADAELNQWAAHADAQTRPNVALTAHALPPPVPPSPALTLVPPPAHDVRDAALQGSMGPGRTVQLCGRDTLLAPERGATGGNASDVAQGAQPQRVLDLRGVVSSATRSKAATAQAAMAGVPEAAEAVAAAKPESTMQQSVPLTVTGDCAGQLVVKSLTEEVNEEMLRRVFSSFGALRKQTQQQKRTHAR